MSHIQNKQISAFYRQSILESPIFVLGKLPTEKKFFVCAC